MCCLGFWFSDDAAAAAGGVGAWSGSVCVWVVVGWVSPRCRFSSPRRVREGGCRVGSAGRQVGVCMLGWSINVYTHTQRSGAPVSVRRTREISDRVVRALGSYSEDPGRGKGVRVARAGAAIACLAGFESRFVRPWEGGSSPSLRRPTRKCLHGQRRISWQSEMV